MLVLVNLKISGLRWLELKMFSGVEVLEMRFKFLDRSNARGHGFVVIVFRR